MYTYYFLTPPYMHVLRYTPGSIALMEEYIPAIYHYETNTNHDRAQVDSPTKALHDQVAHSIYVRLRPLSPTPAFRFASPATPPLNYGPDPQISHVYGLAAHILRGQRGANYAGPLTTNNSHYHKYAIHSDTYLQP